MTLEEREARFTARQEAIARRDAAVAQAAAQYERDKAADDADFAAAFDKIRDDARRAWEAAKARPKPTYDAATARRDEAIAAAEERYNAEIQALFLQQSED